MNFALEFRRAQNLYNIARGVGLPIKIDPSTLSPYHDHYTRVLVEINLSNPLPKRILVSKKNADNTTEFEFFVGVFYKRLPNYCSVCLTTGHNDTACNRKGIRKVNHDTRVKGTRRRGHTDIAKQPKSVQMQGIQEQHAGGSKEQQEDPTCIENSHNKNEVAYQHANSPIRSTHEVGVNVQKDDSMRTAQHEVSAEKSVSIPTSLTKHNVSNPILTAQEVVFNASPIIQTSAANMDKQKVSDTLTVSMDSTSPASAESGGRVKLGKKNSWAVDEEAKEKENEVIHKNVDPGRFQVLQNLEEASAHDVEDSDDGDSKEDSDSEQNNSEIGNVNYDKIFWFKEDNAYAHSSGMRYEVKNKSYTTWVTDDPNDFRCLHYHPFQGVLKFVRTGKKRRDK